jgi:hypothetical protein
MKPYAHWIKGRVVSRTVLEVTWKRKFLTSFADNGSTPSDFIDFAHEKSTLYGRWDL